MKLGISKYILLSMVVGTTLLSCTKKLDVLDQDNPTIASYFQNSSELQKGVNSVYSMLRAGRLVGREWFFVHDMRGVECAPGGPQLEAPRAELLKQNTPASSNFVMSMVWEGCYLMINRANLVISQASEVKDDIALRDRLVGEVKFLRAWAYYELVSQWGDVPLYKEPVSSSKDFKGKSSAADIYAFVISDLTDATKVLPESYSGSDKGRATKGAAYAMLGRANLQKGDYNAAKAALLQIYGKYSLVSNYQWNFDGDVKSSGGATVSTGHEFNSESVFEVVFVDKGDNDYNWSATGEGLASPMSTVRNQEYGITWGNIIPSNYALEQFEDTDPRFKFTIFEEGDQILTQSPSGPKALVVNDMNIATSIRKGVTKKRFFRKYNIYDWVHDGYHPSGLNNRLIRYADALLMLAECEAEVGSPAKAADYINEVRKRPSVNMPNVVASTKEQALKAVIYERSVELCAEAINNIDLLRWKAKGYFPSVTADPRPGMVTMLPIPASEISSNPMLK
ncbi:MAG TPA: RagB/SusD family nutrient uptake outer membrane protein [Niabella sp.]|nr:RagB/SusD family nutrient uptake outer membrane protein [Niabella sp.]HOZ98188.1 RagB/SusD family nutrient uptake outer membrane protein [Niabella sp.]HQW16084.1 RagB/SusD family nutrient uptake outer membrane protein [Niabella sp.]HQX21296.1 RagB/SusD family nutrient uptake outer membrane protein [Niabella sp.]HQX42393.1 RagB/SusD family nutrient uptake outer membrane protein [Niabella sp.]